MRKYYGVNFDDARMMYATVTGQMGNGDFIYTECDSDYNLIDMDKQYIRIRRKATGADRYTNVFIRL